MINELIKSKQLMSLRCRDSGVIASGVSSGQFQQIYTLPAKDLLLVGIEYFIGSDHSENITSYNKTKFTNLQDFNAFNINSQVSTIFEPHQVIEFKDYYNQKFYGLNHFVVEWNLNTDNNPSVEWAISLETILYYVPIKDK